ncbi:WD40 repeat-like protein [Pluteus cervinus]|uniref:WD40 repeat-like protein n=1 Tax=Pluteus cervinus TaxID=181527 RepID=A0ACD3B847_9AGAR|nr:WD40 repeat-like protein [Pluteus cervinus]
MLEIEFAGPNNDIRVKFKRDTLLDVLHQFVLPQSLMDNLGRTQTALVLLFGISSALCELDPKAKVVAGLLGFVKQLLEQQKICYQEISDLFDNMARFFPYFEKAREVEDWKSLQQVIEKILTHMQRTLQTVVSSCQKSNLVQFAQFVLSSEQRDKFSKLSTEFEGLLQEYDFAFKNELSSILAKDQVLKNLEKLKPIEVAPGNTCLKGTRVLILKDLSDWAQMGHDDTYWLYGLAGTGKSTIAASFVQWLQSAKMLGAFFTCRKGHEALSSPLQLLQTICYRLSLVHKPYGRLVAQEIEEDAYFGSGTATIPTLFQQFFEVPLRHLTENASVKLRTLVIVIDALDECGTEDERIQLVHCLTSLRNFCSGLKVFITSRGNNEIQKLLSKCSQVHQLLLSDSDSDIEAFIKSKCSDFHFSDKEVENLVAAAAGLFIWAETAVEYLKKPFNKARGLQILLNLEQESTRSSPYYSLYQLYNTILLEAIPENAENDNIFQRVLGAILLAVKPLTLDMLIQLVGQPNITRQVVQKLIEQLHAVLLQNADGEISVLHLSFSECILQGHCPNRFQILVPEQEGNLAHHCLDILSTQLKFNICGFESSYQLNSQVKSLEERVNNCISTELQYAKVVGLLGQVFHVLKDLSKISSMVMDSKTNTLIKDLAQVIDKYKIPIQYATPHLYISVLPFIPKKSVLLEAIGSNSRILNLKHGKLDHWTSDIVVVEGHNDLVSSVVYSSDGKHIISGSYDQTIRIWDATTGQAIMDPLCGHTESVLSVACSPDGRQIVSGSSDRTVRIWDAITGQLVMDPLQGHTGTVLSVAYSPNGRYIISGSHDTTVRIWNTLTGQPVLDPLQGHTYSIMAVAFSPDSRYIVSGSRNGMIRIWNAITGEPAMAPLQVCTGAVVSLAYSPNGRHIAFGLQNGSIKVCNATTGELVIHLLQGHSSWVWSVDYSPDGRQIVSGSGDETIKVWDAISGELIMEPLKSHTNSILSVAYSPDGRHIVSGSQDHTIRVWDAITGEAAMDSLQGHTNSILSLAYSPDHKYIVSASDDKTIRIWNIITGKSVMNPLQGHSDSVWSISYSPNGKYIVSGSGDRTIRLWNAVTGKLIIEPLQGHTHSVLSVAYSPDSKHIISGSHDKTIRIWNAITGQPDLGPIQGHTGSIWSVAYSPDGMNMISGSDDKTIRVWCTVTGKQVLDPLLGHTGSIPSPKRSED